MIFPAMNLHLVGVFSSLQTLGSLKKKESMSYPFCRSFSQGEGMGEAEIFIQ